MLAMTPIILEALDEAAVVVPVVVAVSVCAKAIPNGVVVLNPRTMIIPIAETDSAATAGKLLDSMLFFGSFLITK